MTGTAMARPVPVTGDSFRDALGRHAAGVVVVTSRPAASAPEGLTATSFTSVSLDPPLVSFYVAASSSTFPKLRTAPSFAVNVLRHDQADLAARFATRGVDRFAAPTRWHSGPRGEPLLDGVAVRLSCAWHSVREIGDHLLVVGHVTNVDLGRDDDLPLLYHRGRFGSFSG